MDETEHELASERLRMGIYISDAVLTMRRQRIRRDNPRLTPARVDQILDMEILARPMDGDGVIVRRPEFG